MSKKILSLVFSAIMLMFGCTDIPLVENDIITQDTVCNENTDWKAYSIWTYVDDKSIVVPGLRQNFVPQGIAYWSDENLFIISGYFLPAENGIKSALIGVNASSGKLDGVYMLADKFGKRIDGHFSGVAVTDKNLYLSHNKYLLQVPLESLKKAESGSIVGIASRYEVGIRDGGCNYADDVLWVCEHRRNGGTNGFGRMIGYRVRDSGELMPYCLFLVPEKVQGITVTESGRLVFSISYGRKNPSTILVYEDPRETTPDGYELLGNAEVPVWELKEDCAAMKLTAPPMSEGCCTVGEKIYLIYESASYLYRDFTPNNRSVDPTDRIWKIDLNKE